MNPTGVVAFFAPRLRHAEAEMDDLENAIVETAKRAVDAAVAKIAPPTEYLRTPQAAAYLGMSRQYLEIARHTGGGPPYIKLSRAVRYKRTDLDEWMAQHRDAG